MELVGVGPQCHLFNFSQGRENRIGWAGRTGLTGNRTLGRSGLHHKIGCGQNREKLVNLCESDRLNWLTGFVFFFFKMEKKYYYFFYKKRKEKAQSKQKFIFFEP